LNEKPQQPKVVNKQNKQTQQHQSAGQEAPSMPTFEH